MMRHRCSAEGGQSVVETAIVLSVLLLLTAGLIDVGRAFYAYNSVANAARFAARWGSVVGGSCSQQNLGLNFSQNDFCNKLSPTPSTDQFWSTYGNYTLPKPVSVPPDWDRLCTKYSPSASSTDPHDAAYYNAREPSGDATQSTTDFRNANETTIVGAVVQRFDSTAGATSVILGDATPGFDLRRLHVCIDSSALNGSQPLPGDWIGVTVTYQFQPAGPLFGSATFDLSATSQFVVE